MKHPVRDRVWIILCALAALCGAAGLVGLIAGKMTLEPVILLLERVSGGLLLKQKIALGAAAAVLVLLALRMIFITLPARKKRSSGFAIQQNENGTVRISIKALEALVQRCLNQHAELKVVTSSLYSDEENVRVDVHIVLQSDISMPLAISALQKQIKRYLEACSGVAVEEVRVFVDGVIAVGEETAKSPYAVPASMLSAETGAAQGSEPLLIEVDDVPSGAAPVEQEQSDESQPEEAGQESEARDETQEEGDPA